MKIFKLKKKSKPDSKDLVPKGIISTVIPKEYLQKFPNNDLGKFTNQKTII